MVNKNHCFYQYLQNFFMVFLLVMASAHADTKIKFTMTPTTNTNVQLNGNEKTIIKYEVKNNTNYTRTMTMLPVTGLFWLTNFPDVCPRPFTLEPGASCNLYLQPQGRNVVSTPIKICKTKGSNDNSPSSYLCSQTSAANEVAVTNTYNLNPLLLVGELAPQEISVCEINNTLNVLENCVKNHVSAQPHSIALNDTFTKVYFNVLYGNQIKICDFSAQDKSIINCQVFTDPSFGSYVHGMDIAPNGKYLYIPFYVSDTVVVCELNSSTGLPFNCVSTGSAFNGPAAIAFNALNTKAYIPNFDSRTIILCDVDASTGQLNNCHVTASLASVAVKIQDIQMSPDSSRVYLTIETPDIYTCDVDTATAELVNCRIAGSFGKQNVKIRFNNSYTKGYVTDYGDMIVTGCDVNANDGSLINCKNWKDLTGSYGLDIAG